MFPKPGERLQVMTGKIAFRFLVRSSVQRPGPGYVGAVCSARVLVT